MVEHAVRDHATWSASSTDRNWNCPGALALTKDLPETTSEAADWGTCAHQVAEKCLRDNVDAVTFIGTTEKAKAHAFEVDEEMADTAQMYVDYIRQRQADYKTATGKNALIFVEERFSLDSLDPPFDAGGTADCVLIFPEWREMEVVDLKGGRGHVVEATGNPQLRTYGLGALLKHQSAKVRKITVTIVQPRAGHKDGRIRSETFHTADLVEWTADLLAAMRRSAEALEQKAKTPPASWASAYLDPGPTGSNCKFCKAKGFCPALEQKALDAAGVWFDDLDRPTISSANAPDAMSAEKLARTLDMLDMIQEWSNGVRAYAHQQAESGVDIPGYVLVEKIGNRAWKADVTPQAVQQVLREAGKDETAAWAPPKAASPAQVEKALGTKHKGALADLVERPIRGTNLVAAEKTTRPAVTPTVNKHFDILD